MEHTRSQWQENERLNLCQAFTVLSYIFRLYRQTQGILPWQEWVESAEQRKPLFYTVSIFPRCSEVFADASSDHSFRLKLNSQTSRIRLNLPPFHALLVVRKTEGSLMQILLFSGSDNNSSFEKMHAHLICTQSDTITWVETIVYLYSFTSFQTFLT